VNWKPILIALVLTSTGAFAQEKPSAANPSEAFDVKSLGDAAAKGHDLSKPLTFTLSASVANSDVGRIKSYLEAQGFTVQAEPADSEKSSLIAKRHAVFSVRDINRISDRANQLMGSAARGSKWQFNQVGSGG